MYAKPCPIETERLLLRPLELSDAAQAQKLFPKWEVVRYLTAAVPWPFPPDGCYRYYQDHALPAMERGEEWHWTLRLKSHPEQMIGSIALLLGDKTNRGFWLGEAWQGRGLMTEAVEAVNCFWFETLGFDRLRAPKAVANIGSVRISAKTGMRLIWTGEQEYVSGKLPTELWEITREDWLHHQCQS